MQKFFSFSVPTVFRTCETQNAIGALTVLSQARELDNTANTYHPVPRTKPSGNRRRPLRYRGPSASRCSGRRRTRRCSLVSNAERLSGPWARNWTATWDVRWSWDLKNLKRIIIIITIQKKKNHCNSREQAYTGNEQIN